MKREMLGWVLIFYSSGKRSPLIPISIFRFPSGECEVQLHSAARRKLIKYVNYHDGSVAYYHTPKYKVDSAFVIGEESIVLNQLKKMMYKLLSDKHASISIHKYGEKSNEFPIQKQSSTGNLCGIDNKNNSNSRRPEQSSSGLDG